MAKQKDCVKSLDSDKKVINTCQTWDLIVKYLLYNGGANYFFKNADTPL